MAAAGCSGIGPAGLDASGSKKAAVLAPPGPSPAAGSACFHSWPSPAQRASADPIGCTPGKRVAQRTSACPVPARSRATRSCAASIRRCPSGYPCRRLHSNCVRPTFRTSTRHGPPCRTASRSVECRWGLCRSCRREIGGARRSRDGCVPSRRWRGGCGGPPRLPSSQSTVF